MRVGYVVLYVDDVEACRQFWTGQVGMVEKAQTVAGDFIIPKVGFAGQDFALELVPLALMSGNPDGLDLATPSMALHVDDLETAREELLSRGVQVTEVGEHSGIASFAFCDNEDRWFAVTKG